MFSLQSAHLSIAPLAVLAGSTALRRYSVPRLRLQVPNSATTWPAVGAWSFSPLGKQEGERSGEGEVGICEFKSSKNMTVNSMRKKEWKQSGKEVENRAKIAAKSMKKEVRTQMSKFIRKSLNSELRGERRTSILIGPCEGFR